MMSRLISTRLDYRTGSRAFNVSRLIGRAGSRGFAIECAGPIARANIIVEIDCGWIACITRTGPSNSFGK